MVIQQFITPCLLFFSLLTTVAVGFSEETRWSVSPRPLASVAPDRQFRTVSEAVAQAEPGDTILLHSGIYRERVVIPAAKSGTKERPLRLFAAPTAEVVLCGSDRLTDWKAEPELGEFVLSTPWQHQIVTPHPNDLEHRWVGRTEQVFVNLYPLRQVLEPRQLSQGTFCVDPEKQRLYLWDTRNAALSDVRGLYVEAAARPQVIQVDAAYVHIKGIRFRHCANRAQHGMADFRGNNLLIEDCIFEDSNASGARFAGNDITVRRCQFLRNGQQGFSIARSHGFRFEESLVADNNVKNFSRDWEAGGNKVVLCRDAVFDRSVFRNNRGVGLWFDIGNENCVVKNCLFLHNEGHGIFYEIGYTMHAHDNVIIGNGTQHPLPSWGRGSGIMISDSMGCVVERNLIVGNGGAGLVYRDQRRTTPRLDTPETSPDKEPDHWLRASAPNVRNPEYWIWNQKHIIRNNIFAYNESSQVHGWFDVQDARHWNRARQAEIIQQEPENFVLDDKSMLPYLAKEGEEPVGRCLENLQLTHENNFFARSDNQKLVIWGAPWRKFVEYDNLAKVAEELLGLERGGVEMPITFADYHALDLRVPADSAAVRMGCYPQGTVPLVRLGTLER